MRHVLQYSERDIIEKYGRVKAKRGEKRMKGEMRRVLLTALIVISLLLVSPVVVPVMAENTTDLKAIYGTPTDDAGEYQEDGVSVRGLDYGCTCASRYCAIDECIVCTAWFRSEYPQDYTIDIWLYCGDSVEEHDSYEGTIGRFGYAEFPMCYCPSEDGWCPGLWKFCFEVEGKTHDSMPAKHCCVFEVVLPNKPDLKITDVWSDDSTIYYRIKNTGGKSAGASSTSLTVDGAPITSDYVASLSSRAARTESFDYIWNCTGTSSRVRVCADCAGDVEEYKENNNCRSRTWVCMPDLTITDIWCDNSTIYYKVKNVGNKKAGVSNTSLTVDDVFETLDHVASLEPGEESAESFNYTWNCTDTNDTIYVCADYTNDVEESNEENNCSKKTWSCADIWVNPTSFDVILPPGAVSNYTLIIGNSGTGPLEFTIDMDKKVAAMASSSDMASTEVIGSPGVVRCECETTSGNSEDFLDASIVIDDEYTAKPQKSLLIHPESTGMENIRQSENVNPISAKAPAVKTMGIAEPLDVENIWLDRKVRIVDDVDHKAGEGATVGYKNVNPSPEENNRTSDEHDQNLNERENQGQNASTIYVGAFVSLYANDTTGNTCVSEPRKVIANDEMEALQDTTPPRCITNLSHICGQTWINWTWVNPDDEDFEYVIVDINGIWQADTSDSHYNATGLVPNASYEIDIRTVGRDGDMNETGVNDTASTLPLAFSVSIISPPDGQVFKPFKQNETIDFHCSVSGGTPPYSLNWSSSVDCFISDEESFGKSLSAGAHVISLSATDNSGLDETASANISVVMGMGEMKIRSAGTIIVPDNYPTIQQAADNATDGDTIFVRSGAYHENIIINNKDLTIGGEGKGATIIDGGGSGDCIRVSSADVNISGFTITNAGNYGIYAYSSDLNINNATITDCGKDAIYFSYGKSLTLRDSVLENCSAGLVYNEYYKSYAQGNAAIERNSIRNNTGNGLYIHLGKGREAIINDNIITNNTGYGIKCDCDYYSNYIDSITMRNNTVRDCVNDGVYIKGAIDIAITDLIIENPGDDGLYASCSRNMTMKSPFSIKNASGYGIYAYGPNFTLDNATITDCGKDAIYFSYGKSLTLRDSVLENCSAGLVYNEYYKS
ncbi:MAG: CARDB domain-containing protein, partial [Euryarchaeota archaeon]|nr:CARDB domain-containing protein [Euryarchaeota archaeon]